MVRRVNKSAMSSGVAGGYPSVSTIPPTRDPRGTHVGPRRPSQSYDPIWDPRGLVGYVAASRSLSRGVGAAPGEPRAEANYDFLISTPRETRVEREHGYIWTV